MFFRPLHDHIAVRPVEIAQRTAGGIFIPEAAERKPDQGEVIAVGSGRRGRRGELRPQTLKPGERVLFDRASATEIKIDGGKLLIMKESDVLAVAKHRKFASDGNRTWMLTPLVTGAVLAVLIGIVAARAIGIV